MYHELLKANSTSLDYTFCSMFLPINDIVKTGNAYLT